MYAEDLGNQRIRIGTNLNRPRMTLLGDNRFFLQVNVDSHLDPGCTAVNDSNEPLSVPVSPSTFGITIIASTTVTYVAPGAGGRSRTTRAVIVLDQTQPVFVLAPHPTLGNVNFF